MRRQNRSEGKIGEPMTALGVIGFLVLAGGFFLLGWLCIGPFMKARMARDASPQRVYSPPIRRHPQTPSTEAQPQQPLDLQITEKTEDQTQAQPDEPQVNPEDNSITMTLEPKENGTEPSPKTTEPEKPQSPSKPRPQMAPNEKPRASTEATRPAAPSDMVYRVQAGTFAGRENAQTLADDLKEGGYRAEIREIQSQGRTLYRVQLGSFRSQEGAKDLAKDLTKKGYSPTVITEKTGQ